MDGAIQDGRSEPFTLGEFAEAGRDRLSLRVVLGGRGLGRKVLEPMTNRPGLALTGFYGHFAWRRLQVIGKAEHAYLTSLEPAVRVERVRSLFSRRAYCLIYTCGMTVPPEVLEIAGEAGASVLVTDRLTREFMHESAFVMAELASPRAKIYGTMVDFAGLGILIEGDPGLGKSETALGLIKRGGALIADDLTHLRKDVASGAIVGSAVEVARDYMEIRGVGIIHVPSVFGVMSVVREKRLDLVITLKRLKEVEGELDRAGGERRMRRLLGNDVPQVVLPVSEGRDLVTLVETAAQQHKLRLAGHDAMQRLDERLCANAIAKMKTT